jgi:dTDP-4-dehydrorhamnose 3,5-epimerase
MKIKSTSLKDLLIIEPTVFYDDRGFFYESYNTKSLKEAGINIDFVQDNHSYSRHGVLRGLHYQKQPFSQTKLVRVIKGSVLDVAVDLRRDSPTFLQHLVLELSADNKLQLLIPQGFAHGFVVLSEEAEFLYKCDNYYNKDADAGIRYDDPDLNIDWGLPKKDIILSEKDASLPLLKDANFVF